MTTEKIFHVIYDYNTNKRRCSKCDLVGIDFFLKCDLESLPKMLHAAIRHTVAEKGYDFKFPDEIELSLVKKSDHHVVIESKTIGESWKPQIYNVEKIELFAN